MKSSLRSSHILLAIAAILLVGFYSVDLKSNQASVFNLPSFSEDANVQQSETQPSPTLKEINNGIVGVAENTKTTVVTVTVTKTVEAQPNPLSRFFGDPRSRQPEQYQREGQGSGIIVSQEGYILTNNHVVEDADEVEVQLYNDQKYTAKVIGTDPRTDIAVLKIDASSELDVIKLGNSDQTRVGELVLAIGNPLQSGLAHSVSMGIISAKNRSIGIIDQGAGYENFLQTDAAINPGNSGGPLVNMDGELIGINTAIASRSGGSEGIGFAVPVEIAKRVMKSIIENGRVIRGYLGIQLGGEVDDAMARALDLNESYGIIVGNVEDGGPADEAGLQEDDVIQTLNGDPVKSWRSFRTAIGTSSPGTEINLGIIRDGERQKLTVTLGEMPEELAMDQQPQTQQQNLDKTLGFRVQDLTPNIAQKLDLSQNQDGVIVAQISQQSEAYRQGLRQGDVITEVDRQPVENTDDFRQAINSLMEENKDVVLLRVIRAGTSQLIAFEL